MPHEFITQEMAVAEKVSAAVVNGHDPAARDPIWVDDDEWSEAALPGRPRIAPGYALRGAVTVIIGPPAAMKSSLMLAWAVAIALGRPHGKFRPHAAGCCIVYNVEDDPYEQRRRLSAVLRQFEALLPHSGPWLANTELRSFCSTILAKGILVSCSRQMVP